MGKRKSFAEMFLQPGEVRAPSAICSVLISTVMWPEISSSRDRGKAGRAVASPLTEKLAVTWPFEFSMVRFHSRLDVTAPKLVFA